MSKRHEPTVVRVNAAGLPNNRVAAVTLCTCGDRSCTLWKRAGR